MRTTTHNLPLSAALLPGPDSLLLANFAAIESVASLRNGRVSDTEAPVLQGIAAQCPVSGGTAVFQARGAIALYEPQTLYGDVETCYGSGINYRPAAPSAPEALEGAAIKLYPNPATDEVTIEAPESVQSWELLDLQGRSIFSGTGNSLFVQSVSPGVYALRITTEMGISTHLLTISR